MFCRLLHLALPIVVLLAGTLPGVEPSATVDDNDLLEAVETELRSDDVVSADRVDVRVEHGVVNLSGSASSLLEQRRLVRLVGSLKGVRAIVNRVRVRPSGHRDEQIFADVQAALRDDPVADKDEIRIKVGNGRVTLEGKVNSFAERRLVEAAVAGVRGVVEIDNRTTINTKIDRTDSQIKPEIVRRFELSPYLAEGLIEVKVDRGSVTLSGFVGSVNERILAGLLCWVPGVNSVDDSALEVQPGLDQKRRRDKFVTLRNDLQIQQAVEDALLYDPRVHGASIDVRVQFGAVSLLGNVPLLAAKRAAEQNAKNTLGVRRVINHLKVKPAEWPGDPAVTKRSQAAIDRDAHLASLDVKASSHFGKVYLSGSVNTLFEKDRAETQVANIPGALSVVNRISVETEWKPKPDGEIEEDVERRLRWSPLLDAQQINVSATDGVVTLRGTVDTHQERETAIEHAKRGGARRVVDQLSVLSGRTTPAGLKATMIQNREIHILASSRAGESFRRFLQAAEKARDYQRLPPAPQVDLVLRLQNEGSQPVDVRLGHDAGGIEMVLAGTGAVHVELERPFVADFHSGAVQTINPGENFDIPIQSLQYGFRNATDRWYWTEPGEYTLHVTLAWPRGKSGLFGKHTVTAEPVKLSVQLDEEAK